MNEPENETQDDTIKLLKECDAGTKMAVDAIDEMLDKIKDKKLQNQLQQSKEHHERLREEIERNLDQKNSEDKNPNPFATSMSWIKTNVMMGLKDSDQTIADLMTDGCNMGIKSLYRYLNKYTNADKASKDICKRLIGIEAELLENLHAYL